MPMKIFVWMLAVVAGILASCAFITVNVYFPEKEVKKAFKTLDEKYLGKEGGEAPVPEQPPAGAEPAPAEKPQSRFEGARWPLAVTATAWAAEDAAGGLVVELSRMPEVVKAYEEMRGRLTTLDQLRDGGIVGETNQGLVTVRDPSRIAGLKGAVDEENANRKTVITGMARAILKQAGKPDTPANMGQVLGKAAATYAQTKQETARPGWWIQLQNGKWVQK
ncbi:putative lipoprotein [Geobacter metallireducens RCH3]|uniref:Lipoprotein, putative n=1 Tax=Geobacter metallireducens (strain ATCC 53774 / DSM 7210 / GS-15) TaxID=269799 RepID=Q39Z08_GEOMG|nr:MULTISPECIES: DUF1318 domain-containing protein [Geobacter]ABB30516.1 lipoprotein, putative [Geobacter metallireducens GS-15]EHP85957.1 putative lipoprotein [Geobacter metallireducens RCH3]MBT1076825.1 DUF1318 domain-containing protein [Geobacter grbiciae]